MVNQVKVGMTSSRPSDLPADPEDAPRAGAANNKEALDSLQDDSVLQDDAAQFAIHRHQVDMQRREEDEPHEAKTSPEACFVPELHASRIC